MEKANLESTLISNCKNSITSGNSNRKILNASSPVSPLRKRKKVSLQFVKIAKKLITSVNYYEIL
jgi:hypothetical protein